MLDILFDENPYPVLEKVDIYTPLLSMEGQATLVSCPVVECLLGDKLTAFAPSTTGILYGLGKEIEMAKQLFDIGELFDVASNVDLIRTTFERIAKKELTYRGMLELIFHRCSLRFISDNLFNWHARSNSCRGPC